MHVANVTFGAYCTQQYTLMYYFYSLVLFRWSTSKHNGVNSFKFVDTYFRGLLKKGIFMDTDFVCPMLSSVYAYMVIKIFIGFLISSFGPIRHEIPQILYTT
jgi:hypothetical protein